MSVANLILTAIRWDPALGYEKDRPAFEHALERGIVSGGHDAPLAGYRAHQVMELGLDGGQVGEDVGVVVFEVVQDGRARPVVHELGALVEEGRVVFVGLDDEGRRKKVRRPPGRPRAGGAPLGGSKRAARSVGALIPCRYP